ncbi:MAG: phage tail assembly chaperone [Hyphomicrobiales bacterium]|jgi:uncharacterized phage protein (TIGR02216 family)|nr:phage tail assembly chaperone [Hyphomicrobiales bacterium]
MAFGFGVLRLGPGDFWSLTPRELAAAFDGLHGKTQRAAPARHALQALMQAFPD